MFHDFNLTNREEMKTPISFIRTFYTILCVALLTIFTLTTNVGQSPLLNLFAGAFLGLIISSLMIGAEILFKRVDFRAVSITLFGLVLGYLFSQVFLMILNTVMDTSLIGIPTPWALFMHIALFLACAYLGMIITLRFSEQMQGNLPFLKTNNIGCSRRDLICDSSILCDQRVIDIASTGLLDQQLVIPKFVLNELYALSETADEEHCKNKAKRSLDTVKKLEGMPNLEIRLDDIDYPELKDMQSKLIRLARDRDAVIFTADVSRVQQLTMDGVRFININFLSNALKPITQTGEILQIKIQRYGKEPRQGVGYLEDGTMVVVNSGAEYIGETINAQVLSVKHTSSGRMIFCNAADERMGFENDHYPSPAIDIERKPKDFMTL